METRKAHATGYAYDLKYASDMLAHIEECAQIDIREYATKDTASDVLLENVTAPGWEFVAIGFATADPEGYTEPSFPCLAHNRDTGAWVWARNLVWFEKERGFCWSNGHYTTEKDAREQYDRRIKYGGTVYHTEEY